MPYTLLHTSMNIPEGFEKYKWFMMWHEEGGGWNSSFYPSKLDCVHEMKAHEDAGKVFFYVVMEIKKIIYPGER